MRVLLLSDIHANLAALDAVLAHAGAYDLIWSLGDVVGYGPQPNECIARLNAHRHLAVAGNHDWAALGQLDLDDFNADARRASLWTRKHLNAESWRYLQALPQTLVEGEFTLVHGSPRHPIWEYLLDMNAAKHNFAYYDTPICFVGHTHIPIIFRGTSGNSEGAYEELAPLEESATSLSLDRYIVNPGSVGQPRDGDPRAAYALLDTEGKRIEYYRASYPIEETQARMRAAGLSRWLAMRLELGW